MTFDINYISKNQCFTSNLHFSYFDGYKYFKIYLPCNKLWIFILLVEWLYQVVLFPYPLLSKCSMPFFALYKKQLY